MAGLCKSSFYHPRTSPPAQITLLQFYVRFPEGSECGWGAGVFGGRPKASRFVGLLETKPS